MLNGAEIPFRRRMPTRSAAIPIKSARHARSTQQRQIRLVINIPSDILYKYTVLIAVAMILPNVHPQPEELHPSLWRASQLARCATRCIDTGHAALSMQLPDGGWPTATLVDLLVQQAGIGEIRLLAPALRKIAHKRVVFLQPPHPPQAIALAGMGLAPSQLIWLKSSTSADALWAAEQVLRSGSCGALLFWSTHMRSESLRRLHLAAQAGEALFFALRPLAAAQDASPASLRLSLRPAPGGINIGFLKRRGPQRDEPLFLPMAGNNKTLAAGHQVTRLTPTVAAVRAAREEVDH